MAQYKLSNWTTQNTAENLPKILLIYTGGTIGMVYNAAQGGLVPFHFKNIEANLPEIGRLEANLTVLEMDEIIDSANMSIAYWQKLAKIIHKYYHQFHAFVLLHGTDTMAYTASALSFMLEGLHKPVILTGAQIPMGKARTDAKENLITALEIAISQANASKPLQEVAIYFNNSLLRGNRSRKLESELFNAFVSENYPPLATVGVSIDYHLSNYHQQTHNESFHLKLAMDPNVAVVKLYPGISEAYLNSILVIPGLKGLLVESYGAGNFPNAPWLLHFFESCYYKNILLFNISQCNGGRVSVGQYASAKDFSNLFANGADISAEAAITKLMWVLGQDLDYASSKLLLETNIAGELTAGQ
jgi:L-asparaginase